MSLKMKPFAIGGVLLFLALPLVMNDRDNSSLEKDDFFSIRSSDYSSSPRENPFNRYLNRLKKFYNFGNDSSENTNNPDIPQKAKSEGKKPSLLARIKTGFSGDKNADTAEADIYEADEYEILSMKNAPASISAYRGKNQYEGEIIYEKDNNSYNKGSSSFGGSFGGSLAGEEFLFSQEKETSGDVPFINGVNYTASSPNTVNLEQGTVLTADNFLLRPTQEGYYYKGKFFKNGKYPRFANRDYVEGALNRYHSQVASKLRKKAIYLQDQKGNLTVSYVDQLPNKFAPKAQEGETLLASNKFRDGFNRYKGARINGKNNVIESDIAGMSLKDMHDAYDLLNSQIQNGTLTSGYKLKFKTDDNYVDSPINALLQQAGGENLNITDKPNPNANTAPIETNDNDAVTIVMGGKDFSDNYAFGIHDLGCGTAEIFTFKEVMDYNIGDQLLSNPMIGIALGTCAPPLYITPSTNISEHISQDADLQTLKDRINSSLVNSDKTVVKVVSTDRNTAPMVEMLNDEKSIKNKNGEDVNVVFVGPKEGVSDLSVAMGEITNSVIEESDKAEELNHTLMQFYLATQLKPTNTIVAFPAGNGQVFVVNDPNNSYWIKNPKEVNKYGKTYLIKKGVYYQGAIIDSDEVMKMLEKDRTNFLLVSKQEGQRVLDNGTVLQTVNEDEINMNSYDPDAILQNTSLIKKITSIGDKTMRKRNATSLNSASNIAKSKKKQHKEKSKSDKDKAGTTQKDSKLTFKSVQAPSGNK